MTFVSKRLSDDLAELFTKGFLDDSMVESIVEIVRKHDKVVGIQSHDGQKLLVQIVLDNDKGLNHSSRVILEKLIEG